MEKEIIAVYVSDYDVQQVKSCLSIEDAETFLISCANHDPEALNMGVIVKDITEFYHCARRYYGYIFTGKRGDVLSKE